MRVAHARQANAPQDGAARDVDGDHAQRGARARQLDVVDADHLAPVGVDDLAVEHLAREQQLAGLRGVVVERGGGDAQQHARLLEAGDGVPGRAQAAVAPLEDERGHARVLLPGR